jgi:anthranilate phosphoribosyltransferase
MITDALRKLVDRVDLSHEEAGRTMEEIMTGQATDAQIAGFLTALRMKGESVTELIAFAQVMQDRAQPLWDGETMPVLDTCGTGGDRSGSFNISTAAAFVVAGAGIRVAKHGNRSATSRCGSADVMEALGIDIQMPIERLRLAIKDPGIGFLFAQRFHSSMKFVAAARSQLEVRTVFNILGPLANPARAQYHVIGVFSPSVGELIANALCGLNSRHAFVVHGADGLDEISISGRTRVIEVRDNAVTSYTISPEDFDIPPASVTSILGGDPATNAEIIESVLRGERGPRRDVVLMNASAAIVAGGVARDLREGLQLAALSIDSGKALGKLHALRELSR